MAIFGTMSPIEFLASIIFILIIINKNKRIDKYKEFYFLTKRRQARIKDSIRSKVYNYLLKNIYGLFYSSYSPKKESEKKKR